MSNIVCPHFQKGNPNFENFKKGEPEKGKPKGGGRFLERKAEGTQLFKLNLEIEKEKIGTFREKLGSISSNIFLQQQKVHLLVHLLCIPCINGSKEFYRDIYVKQFFKFGAKKVLQKFWCKRRENQFFKF